MEFQPLFCVYLGVCGWVPFLFRRDMETFVPALIITLTCATILGWHYLLYLIS